MLVTSMRCSWRPTKHGNIFQFNISGDHDKNDGWFRPDNSRYFKKKNGLYPASAYEPLNAEFCGDECDDLVLPRSLPVCFKPSFQSLQSNAKDVLEVFMEDKFQPIMDFSLHPVDRLVQDAIRKIYRHRSTDKKNAFRQENYM